MKALILAAGRGSRMKEKTNLVPKGMLKIGCNSIVEDTINKLRSNGIVDIALVTGYKSEVYKKKLQNVTFFENSNWETTNSTYSLLCALGWINQNVIIIYSDIYVSHEVIQLMLKEHSEDWVMPYNKNFKQHWEWRFPGQNIFDDIESFNVDKNGYLVDIGNKVSSDTQIDGQFMGIFKVNERGIRDFKKYILEIVELDFSTDITAMFNYLLKKMLKVKTVEYNGPWFEFDCFDDFNYFEKNIGGTS